ncbi:MAG: hypothetical protein WBW41_09925 [Verrucomicrobiia bacterium]
MLITLSLTCATTGFGAAIIYDFQNLPAGPLPGGFLSLTVDGVNAFFSAAGTTVDVNSVTGTHVLHTGNYQSQMGIEFSIPVTQITVGIDSSIPTMNNSVSTFEYYGAGDNLYPMSTISSSGSTLVFNVPNNFPEVLGILLDGNSGNGYSLDYVSIQTVPEPGLSGLLLLGFLLCGVSRRSPVQRTTR